LDHLKDRHLFIGSSDAKKIMGNDWQDLWLRKTGRKESDDLSDVFRVQLGVFTEDFHLDWTFRKFLQGETAKAASSWKMSKHSVGNEQHQIVRKSSLDTPLRSHPDALITNLNDPKEGLPIEVKHSGAFLNANAACDWYMPQLQHHMFCWGKRNLLFSVILGNNEPERIWVERNDEYVHHYLTRADMFWDLVKSDTPPDDLFLHDNILHSSITDNIRKNGMVRRNIAEDNHLTSLVQDLYETAPAAKQHADTKTIIKKEMKEDEAELYSNRVSIKKNKRGAVTIKLVGE